MKILGGGDLFIFFYSNRTCVVIGDKTNVLSDLDEWSESNPTKILISNPSTYLTGASFAVFEALQKSEVNLTINKYSKNYSVLNKLDSANIFFCAMTPKSQKSHKNY